MLGEFLENCEIKDLKPRIPNFDLDTLSILNSERWQDFLHELETQKLKGVSGSQGLTSPLSREFWGILNMQVESLHPMEIYALPYSNTEVAIIDPKSNGT
jgi:hypothetical protein